MLRKLSTFIAALSFFGLARAAEPVITCGTADDRLHTTCETWKRVSQRGDWDLYLTGYGWHINGYEGRRNQLNANSFGGGAGKHWTDANGNDDLLLSFVFMDSHHDPEPMVGYARQWYTPVVAGFSVGAGYFAGLSARNDVLHFVPFPIALPVASLRYRRVSLMGTLIPRLGSLNEGTVAFFFGRYAF